MIACSYNGWSRDNAWLTSPNPEKCDNTRLQPHWRRECDHDSSWILQLIAQIAFVRDFSWAASAFGQVSSPLVTLAVEPKHSAARKKPLAPRVRLCLLKNWKWTWQITRSFRESFVCGIWNTESILGFEIWNTAQGIRNPAQGRIQDFV